MPGADGKPITPMPAALVALPHWPGKTAGQADVGWLFSHFLIALPLLFYFVCAEFFSTLGTLIGVTGAANLRRPDGSIPSATAAFGTDAVPRPSSARCWARRWSPRSSNPSRACRRAGAPG